LIGEETVLQNGQIASVTRRKIWVASKPLRFGLERRCRHREAVVVEPNEELIRPPQIVVLRRLSLRSECGTPPTLCGTPIVDT